MSSEAPSLTSLPDEVLLRMAHMYLDPPDILSLALTGPRMTQVLLSHPGDVARVRALFGTMHCVARRWWTAAGIALRGVGDEMVEWGDERGSGKYQVSVASAALLELCMKKTQDEIGESGVAFAAGVLAHPAVDPGAKDNYAIRKAAEFGHAAVVALLLEDPRVDPTAMDNEPLGLAAMDSHTAVVKLLLGDPRVDPGADDNYAIREASRNGHMDVVALLLADPRVDPAADDNSAITSAASNGHTAVVKLLLEDPRVDPAVMAMCRASKNGHTAVVALLLGDPRVDPAAMDNFAIRWASKYEHGDVVALLAAHPQVDASVLDA